MNKMENKITRRNGREGIGGRPDCLCREKKEEGRREREEEEVEEKEG